MKTLTVPIRVVMRWGGGEPVLLLAIGDEDDPRVLVQTDTDRLHQHRLSDLKVLRAHESGSPAASASVDS